MGYVSVHNVKKAGDYLLRVLLDSGEVRYSRFYDGTDETQAAVLKGMGFPEEGEDYEPESPELLLDLAAYELERQGFVRITMLDTKLADGEPDYLIELTEQGREKLAQGKEPLFRDFDL